MGTENPNPYASPQAVDEVVPTAFPDGEGYYRDGKLLVVKNGAELPDRCVYCNEPSAPFRKTCNTLWISLVVRRVRISYGVCRKHRFRRRTLWLFLFCLLGLMYLTGVIFGRIIQPAIGETMAEFQLAGVILPQLLFLIVVMCLLDASTIRVRKADHTKVWLRGAREPFLASLNEAEE